MVSVRFVDVVKRFGAVTAVDHVSIDVKDGEFLSLLGPSGSGKTTILRMLAGLETVTEGEIYVGDEMVNDIAPKDRDIAMVFQNYALYPHMTVRDNISLPLKVRKLSEQRIHDSIKKASDYLQIGHILDKKPGQLSGGEQQRAALARAIVREPKVFLFDEPLSNLDAKLRVSARGFLKRLQKEVGTTTIYVTHDQSEAMTMADTIVVMEKGKVQQSATPSALFSDPANMFVAGFLGSPSMNFIEGSLSGGKGGMEFTAEKAPIRLSGVQAGLPAGGAVLGVRPEDVQVSLDPKGADFEAAIYVQEPLGSVQYLTLEVNGIRFIAQAKANLSVALNQKVGCSIDRKRMYFFDPKSSNRLG
jgi:multiple sugar transport system ATP-binding protein